MRLFFGWTAKSLFCIQTKSFERHTLISLSLKDLSWIHRRGKKVREAFKSIFKSFFHKYSPSLSISYRSISLTEKSCTYVEIKWYFIYSILFLLLVEGQNINKSRVPLFLLLLLLPCILSINLCDFSLFLICRYYGVSMTWIDWTSMIYMILYIPLVFPGSWILDKLVSICHIAD